MSGEDEPQNTHTDEWEPPGLLEAIPGNFERTPVQRQVLFHLAMFAILGASLGLVFGALELIRQPTNAIGGSQREIRLTGMIISGYLMTLLISPFLALVSGIITARSLDSSSTDCALVSAVGSTFGFVVLLATLFLGGTLVGGAPGGFSDSLTATPLHYLPYGLGIAFASGSAGFATAVLLDGDE